MCHFEREKPISSFQEAHMISIADGSVRIQTSAEAQAAAPSWLGEVALVASHLQKQGIASKICVRAADRGWLARAWARRAVARAPGHRSTAPERRNLQGLYPRRKPACLASGRGALYQCAPPVVWPRVPDPGAGSNAQAGESLGEVICGLPGSAANHHVKGGRGAFQSP